MFLYCELKSVDLISISSGLRIKALALRQRHAARAVEVLVGRPGEVASFPTMQPYTATAMVRLTRNISSAGMGDVEELIGMIYLVGIRLASDWLN